MGANNEAILEIKEDKTEERGPTPGADDRTHAKGKPMRPL